MVQFARSAARCEHSTESVAIKFFLNRNAFDCEEALYMRPELRGMMPAISMLQNNESVRTFVSFFLRSCCSYLSFFPLYLEMLW